MSSLTALAGAAPQRQRQRPNITMPSPTKAIAPADSAMRRRAWPWQRVTIGPFIGVVERVSPPRPHERGFAKSWYGNCAPCCHSLIDVPQENCWSVSGTDTHSTAATTTTSAIIRGTPIASTVRRAVMCPVHHLLDCPVRLGLSEPHIHESHMMVGFRSNSPGLPAWPTRSPVGPGA